MAAITNTSFPSQLFSLQDVKFLSVLIARWSQDEQHLHTARYTYDILTEVAL